MKFSAFLSAKLPNQKLLYTLLKKIINISLLLSNLLSFGQKIKTITKFKNKKDSLIRVRTTTFDNYGNLTKVVIFYKVDDFNVFKNFSFLKQDLKYPLKYQFHNNFFSHPF